MPSTIALLTDFGTSDAYVGVMKAVMKRINPDLDFIDITHEIQAQNVRQAAFVLLNSYRFFAPGTIFLVVVDPGVGGTRRPIAANVGDYTFVAPDNGILSYVLGDFSSPTVVELTNLMYQMSAVSYTFHGRDIFAPAAAHLAAGIPIQNFGAPVDRLYKQLLPVLRTSETEITGNVLHSDRFGNVVTSIGELKWIENHHLLLSPRFGARDASRIINPTTAIVRVKNIHVGSIRRTYNDAGRSEMLSLVDSNDFLEIAINQGNAAKQHTFAPGDPVVIELK
jgi:S-adenosylmethionine hydrolase